MNRCLIKALGVLFTASCFVWSAEAGLSPTRLRCEYLEDPAAIDVSNPQLSWAVGTESPAERGQRQTAYRILVASTPDLLEPGKSDRWDSGKVASDETVGIAYAGTPLISRQRCWWSVRVWDKNDKPSAWSEPAVWTMGLLKPEDWTATWIGKDEPEQSTGNPLVSTGAKWIWHDEPTPNFNAPVCRRVFTRTFTIPENATIQSAEAWVAVDNEGEVKINGNPRGKAGSFKQARLINLAPGMKTGKNSITVSVSNVGDAPNPAGLLALVRITLVNGNEISIVTDESWESSIDEKSPKKKAKALAPVGQGPWGKVAATRQDRVLPARYLRKEFLLSEKPQRATAYLVGLGYYELYLNGGKIGDHVLDPILTDYAHRVPYVTYDVTSQLDAGPNAVGVILGNGRYYAPRLKVPTQTKTYGYPKLLLQIECTYADGRTERVVSDDTWSLTANGPILENNDYDGEVSDARLVMPQWARVSFKEEGWQKAQVVGAPKGKPVAAMMPPMRVVETINPVSMNEPKPGVWVYDLGQNIVGWCKVAVNIPEGWTVKLRHAERINDDGTLYVANLRGAKCRDLYISNGRLAVYEPRFTYHGFRYAEITLVPPEEGGVTDFKPSIDTLQGRVVHTDMRVTGRFATSNDLVNRLYKNIEWGLRGNYLSIPTDCPQRDERQGWQGDRAMESKGEMFMFDCAPLYRKWLQDIADSQRPDGVLSSVCPNFWPMYPGDVTWPSAFTIIPQSLRLQFADTRGIETHYDAMKRWLAFFEPHIKDGLLARDTYGDWCVPPESPELIHSKDPARKTSKPVLATSYYVNNLNLVAGYADLLGKNDDAAQYRERARTMTEAFNKKFLNRKTGTYDNGTQTASVLPLAFGMVPNSERDKVYQALVDNLVNKTDGHVGTGLIGGQWLNRVLTAGGRPDLSVNLATHKDYPSWGYMIENGATTLWELWNGNTANPAMNSGNHVMLVGDLAIWFYESLAGLRADPERPGFKHVLMQPEFVKGLDFVDARFQSVRGPFESRWRRSGDGVTWKVSLPPNTTATALIPARSADALTESGKPLSASEGVRVNGFADGRVKCQLQSGAYFFKTQLSR